MSTHYLLEIVCENETLRKRYEILAKNHNAHIDMRDSNKIDGTFNAGFDLLIPEKVIVNEGKCSAIDHKIKCSMRFLLDNTAAAQHLSLYCGYYLYPRSSTGLRTPLRLANSVGIIDSGYRGNITAVFDNIGSAAYDIEANTRLVQICPPNLTYPIRVVIHKSIDALNKTDRGEDGFGSSGD